jgi:hypothetical protein
VARAEQSHSPGSHLVCLVSRTDNHGSDRSDRHRHFNRKGALACAADIALRAVGIRVTSTSSTVAKCGCSRKDRDMAVLRAEWPFPLILAGALLGLFAEPAVAGPPFVSDAPNRDGGRDRNRLRLRSGSRPSAHGDVASGLQRCCRRRDARRARQRRTCRQVPLSASRWIRLDVSVFPRVFLPSGSGTIGDNHASLLLPIWVQKGLWQAMVRFRRRRVHLQRGARSGFLSGRHRGDLSGAPEASDRGESSSIKPRMVRLSVSTASFCRVPRCGNIRVKPTKSDFARRANRFRKSEDHSHL